MSDDVERMLDLSKKLEADLIPLFEHPRSPRSQQTLLTMTLCDLALEFWSSQRLLIGAGRHAAAMALVRLQFEAVVRAIWMHHGASEEWLTRFTAPMAPEQLAEPVLGPNVDAMLLTIGRTAPPFIAQMLGELKSASWQPMNSYVHGGIRAIGQTLAGSTPHQLVSVLRNGNGLALLTANLLVVAHADPRLVGLIRAIQARHGECMPPPRPGAT
jgi:hypothetical protein